MVMYDLIPVSHPQFCDPRVARDFQRDAPRVLSLANAVVAISATVAGQVRDYAAQAITGWDPQRCPVGFFHLGADFIPAADPTAAEWPGWPNGLWADRPVFLMLGTLEPRKGHAFVLDAFEQRWQQGATEGLLFLGSLAAGMAETHARLAAIAQEGRPFWHLRGVPDSAVATAIRRSRAGIVASCVEGFGLPIVEFMQMGLPVLASDIPVFREVGGDLPIYFSLDRAGGLGAALDSFYRRESALRQTLLDFRWPNWDAAAETLLRQVLELTA
ncbi:MAG: glycosyltransferase family 4 protein [Lentisphaerae bacterium]|nr:glycosyltransferase family 4 protein [Lentisphaerota bacterium]